jgi:quercetin dioxygenase-like cupin family protein
MSIKELSERAGVSYLTMQRIETDKISPSVVLLSQIATSLNYPITSFLPETEKTAKHIKAGEQRLIETGKLKLKLVAPKGVLTENVSIVLGKTEKGKVVDTHKHEGFELAYIIKGRAILKLGAKKFELNEGDLIYYDASQRHSVVTEEPMEFFGIQIYGGEKNGDFD